MKRSAMHFSSKPLTAVTVLLLSCVLTTAEWSSSLEAIQTKYHLPGLAAARIGIHHHENITAHAVGIRKMGDTSPLSTLDKFHLGSLTKAMTATLIAILIDDGINDLSWNTTVPEALPHLNIPLAHQNTTLMMLASHRAGLNDTSFLLSEQPLWLSLANQTYTPIEGRGLVAERAFAYTLATPPGEAFLYSNLGYMILGHLLDMYHPSGGWEDYIQRKLWNPLGMTECGFGPVPQGQNGEPLNPWPHLPGQNGTGPIPVPWETDNPPTLGPAGTVHCSISSYARFLLLHLSTMLGFRSCLLPREAFRALHTPYRLLAGAPKVGGIGDAYTPGGWVLEDGGPALKNYLLHDGSNTVNYAVALVVPEKGEAFFIGTNVGNAATATNEVAAGLLSASLELV